ncbi:MAG: oxygen-independent coproporphyrinogen III oxidase [Porticoccaceae bacterium]|nr:oxygen-independent coproporphyrinogen III oxidase [Pseudomonadales bacterium]MCP5171894.1 oxygen-independent coproporphyrinogen III oxidase [Pseudomonadales bacterium]
MNTSMVWDRSLINRYDLSGPRYTSYPTAPQFHEQFDEQDLRAAIERSNASGRPLSLYFHIPFCSTVCYYCGCNKVITANRKRALPYLNRMIREIAMQAALFDCSRPVQQLHWGGGTPTYISDAEKFLLMASIRDHFNLLDDDSGEYSIEIHPGDMEVASITCLRELGFNRLSMGIQDFDPVVQKAVNRFNSVDEVKALVNAARDEGFHSISMDLIYGLPHQSWQTFNRTLDNIIDLNPDRLSIFNYAHMPHLFKVQKQIDASALPTSEEKLLMMERMTARLLDAGYVYIGMDHFAKPEDELAVAQREGVLQRNFQGYATHGNCDMVAFGVSSISAIDNVFAQNHKQIEDYQDALDGGKLPLARGFELSADDLLRQDVIKQLICHFELDIPRIEQQYGIDFPSYFGEEITALQPMVKDGLVDVETTFIRVTPAGRILIRRICMVFDAYLKKPTTEIRYSKII